MFESVPSPCLLPAGFFDEDDGEFDFDGTVDGVELEVEVRVLGDDTFEIEVETESADLTGTLNPVTVELAIGNDRGSTSVVAEIEGN